VLHICVFTIGHQFPVHRKSIGKNITQETTVSLIGREVPGGYVFSVFFKQLILY